MRERKKKRCIRLHSFSLLFSEKLFLLPSKSTNTTLRFFLTQPPPREILFISTSPNNQFFSISTPTRSSHIKTPSITGELRRPPNRRTTFIKTPYRRSRRATLYLHLKILHRKPSPSPFITPASTITVFIVSHVRRCG